MSFRELRTTSFILSPKEYGHVFVYKPGKGFRSVWRRLSDLKRPSGQEHYRLPDASLRAALTVLSGDFVTLDAWRWGREDWAIVSRKRIGTAELRRAFAAWEYVVWPQGATGELGSAAAEDLVVERFSIGDLLGLRPGRCPSPEAKWVWKAGHWEIAHRLAAAPLRLDQGHTAVLKLDGEACLLTWDNLRRAGRTDGCAAMHVIAPRLITLPGLEQPVVHLQSSFVRLATEWNRWVKHAWVDQGPQWPLLYAAVYRRRSGVSGEWSSVWGDQTAEVLRRCNLPTPALPSEIDLSGCGRVRGRLQTPPQRYPIGTGCGQMFHEAVALHARRLLPNAVPVELVKARSTLAPRPATEPDRETIDLAICATGSARLHLTCLYGDDRTRRRLWKAIYGLLGLPAETRPLPEDGVETTIGKLTFVFCSPPGASARLCGQTDRDGLEQWVVQAIERPSSPSDHGTIRAAIIETGDPNVLRGSDRDPKHVIRRVLAGRGIVTQFLSSHSLEEDGEETTEAGASEPADHAAERAVWDLLRSAGVFPHRFPTVEGLSADPWLIGVHVVQRRNDRKSGFRRKWGEGFVVSIVAVKAGDRRAMGFDPQSGWQPLNVFTASFLASPQDMDEARAKSTIETAVEQLLAREPHAKAVLFLDARGCRRFWDALADTRGDRLPRCARADRVGIVRVRPDADEVPRVAGPGGWPASNDLGPGKPSVTNALYRLEQERWPAAMFYVSASATLERPGAHRDHTRFSCTPGALRKNWHALTMTEFWSPFPGPFVPDQLYELAAVLCRHAPTWNGTLERPAPIHLAEAIVLDHPDKYEVRDQDGQTLAIEE